jgi:4-amino-4-deoxy-L-arabinose transferase-like glycosyltransferase
MGASPRLRAFHYALLALLALALFVPGRDKLPPLDRDESRYMEATAQMLQSGDFIDVRFQDEPRYKQPAGIYWLQAAAVAASGTLQQRTPWAYRIPSLIGATLAVLLTAWIGTTLFGRLAGLAAGVLLAGSVLLGVEARMATIDATLLAVVLAAQAALLVVFLRRDSADPPGRAPAALYWAALGFGLMLKGPVILLVSWGTILALMGAERRVRWLKRLQPKWGVPLMLAIVLPWCIAIALVSHGSFFSSAVGHNLLAKVASGQEAHGLPPGTYLLAFTLAFWPGSLLAVLALPLVWTERRSPQVRFLLAWIIPTWFVFELVATKLPHYVLPTYPAIACLAGAALAARAWRGGRVWFWVSRVYGGIWALVGLGLALAGPVLLWWFEDRFSPPALLLGLAALALVAAALWCVLRALAWYALAASTAAALLVALSAYVFVLPELSTIWLSPRVAAAVESLRPCPDSVVASASDHEPSLVFLLGKDTRLVTADGAADSLLAQRACGLALVGAQEQPAFLARLAAANVTPRRLTEIDGMNYSTGKRLALTLWAGPGG